MEKMHSSVQNKDYKNLRSLFSNEAIVISVVDDEIETKSVEEAIEAMTIACSEMKKMVTKYKILEFKSGEPMILKIDYKEKIFYDKKVNTIKYEEEIVFGKDTLIAQVTCKYK